MTRGVPALTEALNVEREVIAKAIKEGTWTPPAGDVLSECAFVKTGFRSWGLESADKTWRLLISKLDFGSRDPSALITVYAPNHPNAFGDLEWFVFSNAIGVNGGTNYNQTVTRLHKSLGGAELDWGRRIVYLVERARFANAGSNNGTFKMTGLPVVTTPPPFVFEERMREGRTISLFGPGSAGKTTLVDGLIASACSGHEVIPGWRPTRQYNVLVLDWDEGHEEEQIRLRAICLAHQIVLTAEYHYKRMARPLHDVADEIGSYVVANKIEIVVVSPMGRAQRNFGENITAPVDEVHEILRSFGTTNILIDHVTGENIKGKAEREFGSIRKRDNVRGSYAVDVQFEEPGKRVLVMRNTKADALSPRQPDQAVRVIFEPPWPDENGQYAAIHFHPDEVVVTVSDTVTEHQEVPRLKDLIYDALEGTKLTPAELSKIVLYAEESCRRTLYRWSKTRTENPLFNKLPSGAWERLSRLAIVRSEDEV